MRAKSRVDEKKLIGGNDMPVGSEHRTRGLLFIVSAPSGAGKTSLVRAMIERLDSLVVSVSHTTREPREGEVDGVDYHFVSAEKFACMVAAGAFLEHAQVFDHAYGTAHADVEQRLADGLDVILEIDWQGARAVRTLLPDAVAVYILPPSIDVLEQRLRARAQDDEQIIARRMRDARLELSHADEYDFQIVNADFEQAACALQELIEGQRCHRQ